MGCLPEKGIREEEHGEFVFTEIVFESASWLTVLIFFMLSNYEHLKRGQKITRKRRNYNLKKMDPLQFLDI
jgi:hypothetical protein